MTVEKYYTGHELAELLRLDYGTIMRLAWAGELPSVRIGRMRRFPESAVQAWLDRQREQNHGSSDGRTTTYG